MSRIKIFLSVGLIIFLGMVMGCKNRSSGNNNLPEPKEVQLTEEGGACGSGVGLNVGDTLNLILDGAPSTGYTWEVGFYVPEVIKPTGEPEQQSDSNLVGASEAYLFRFLAVGEGEVTLRMIYHKPWEKDVADLKTCEVTIKVE